MIFKLQMLLLKLEVKWLHRERKRLLKRVVDTQNTIADVDKQIGMFEETVDKANKHFNKNN